FLVVPGPLQQHRQRADVVRAEHHVDPRRSLDDLAAILLRQATTHRDLQVRALLLGGRKMPQVAVQLVVGVLPDRARVQHDDVRLLLARGLVARVLELTGQPFRVVHVHLAAERANLVLERHASRVGPELTAPDAASMLRPARTAGAPGPGRLFARLAPPRPSEPARPAPSSRVSIRTPRRATALGTGTPSARST